MAREGNKLNRGTLARNEHREKDSQPEFTGSINVEGKEYWLNGWVNDSKNEAGKQFFGLSVKAKDAANGSRKPSRESPPPNSDIPI